MNEFKNEYIFYNHGIRTYRDILTNHELQLITKVKRRDQANTEKANS